MGAPPQDNSLVQCKNMSLTLTRRGEFWKDEKQRCSGKAGTEEAK